MSADETVLMTVGGLTLDPVTKTPIVILKDADNRLNLPIWIGLLEATAMATEIEGIKMARPMTHDLLRSVLGEVGAVVECVEVVDLRENTYFALIHLRINDRRLAIDVHTAPDHFVRVQREDLEEMLGNIVDNACKWASSRVEIRSTAATGGITITVDEDGAGLEPSLREAVLQRGVRADEAAPGSGLGLAIVRDLAELYGGSIGLSGSPLGGLRATLTLRAD